MLLATRTIDQSNTSCVHHPSFSMNNTQVPLPPELRKDLRAMREDYNAETPEAVPIEVKKEEAGSQSFGWDGQVASQSPFMEVDPRGHMHRPSKSRTFVNLVVCGKKIAIYSDEKR